MFDRCLAAAGGQALQLYGLIEFGEDKTRWEHDRDHRRATIESLENEKSRLENDIDQLKQKVLGLSDVEKLSEEKSSLESRVRSLTDDVSRLIKQTQEATADFESRQKDLKALTTKLKSTRSDLADRGQELNELDAQFAILKKERDEAVNEKKQAVSLIVELGLRSVVEEVGVIEGLEQKKTQVSQELQELQDDAKREEEKVSKAKEELEAVQGTHQKLRQQEQDLRTKIANLETIQDLGGQITELENSKRDANKELSELRKDVEMKGGELARVQGQIGSGEQRLEDLRRNIVGLQKTEERILPLRNELETIESQLKDARSELLRIAVQLPKELKEVRARLEAAAGSAADIEPTTTDANVDSGESIESEESTETADPDEALDSSTPRDDTTE